MKLRILVLLATISLAGYNSSTDASHRWPESQVFLGVERWSLAAGYGFACELRGRILTIRTLNDYSQPGKTIFHRALSASQQQRIVDAIHEGGLLQKLGQSVRPPPPPPGEEVVELSDGELDRFRLREGALAKIRSMTVEYWNYSDSSARRVF
jgi:hypothetical protein